MEIATRKIVTAVVAGFMMGFLSIERYDRAFSYHDCREINMICFSEMEGLNGNNALLISALKGIHGKIQALAL